MTWDFFIPFAIGVFVGILLTPAINEFFKDDD